MAVSTSTLELEIGVVFVAVFAVLVGLYALNRYMKRRGPELATREGRTVLSDRAYNQIRIGQAAADRLGRTGVDVSAAKSLLDRAEAARAGGNYSAAIEQARKAQDLLAASHSTSSPLAAATVNRPESPGRSDRNAPVSAGNGVGMTRFTAPPSVPVVAPGPVGEAEPAPAPETLPGRPPKNKMESRFQLSLARDEVEQARKDRSRTKALREADALLARGQEAFDKEEFTEALRLALKSRRALGARVEALPLSAGASVNSPTNDSVSDFRSNSGRSPIPASTGGNCPKCGRATAPDDQFCRGCGAPLTASACRNCGAPLLAGDRFCGKCGATQG
jgi:double zinc ribbon protein